jgi:hypothetical protein
MRNSSIRDRMKKRTRTERTADWEKPRTGNFIKDFLEGNKAAIKALRQIREETEKQSVARVSQGSS